VKTFRIYAIVFIVVVIALNIFVSSLVTFLLSMFAFALLIVVLLPGSKNKKENKRND
jgi:Flp pilus assembly protein TadB